MTVALNEFGPLIDAFDVEGWLAALINKWFEEYAAEYERLKGKPPRYWPRPFTIETSSTFDTWREDQLPHVIIISPGLENEPVRRGDGTYEVTYYMTVTGIVYGTTRHYTRENQIALGSIIKWMIEQHKDLDHPEAIAANRWVDEDFTEIDSNDSRTLGSASEVFAITVKGVMNDLGGPPEKDPRPDPYPYEEPPGDLPVVQPGKTYAEIFKTGESH